MQPRRHRFGFVPCSQVGIMALRIFTCFFFSFSLSNDIFAPLHTLIVRIPPLEFDEYLFNRFPLIQNTDNLNQIKTNRRQQTGPTYRIFKISLNYKNRIEFNLNRKIASLSIVCLFVGRTVASKSRCN